MKHSRWIGLFVCIILILACFIPWTYYPDINKTFTGFFSENNSYGKPGKFFIFFALISALLIIIPKIWAKRIHIILAALAVGYAIKSYILFTSCYNTICPEKKLGIYLMLLSNFCILIIAFFPDIRIKKDND